MAGESLNRIDAVESRLAETKLGAQTERVAGRRPGHGAGDVGLPEQAKRLRCGAEDLLAGAAHVAVPVPERLIEGLGALAARAVATA